MILINSFRDTEVIIKKLYVIVVAELFEDTRSLDNHIDKGCYTRETNQFKLSKDKVFFNSHQTLARNDFIQYGDEESEMLKDMKPDGSIGMRSTFHKDSDFTI